MLEIKSLKNSQRGMTLIEVAISVAVVSLMAVGVLQALLMCERYSASMRLQTNARAITQRNINAASEVGFTGTGSAAPMVLRITGTTSTGAIAGAVCDDDAGSSLENISVLLSGTSAGTLASGTLTRFVSQLPTTAYSTTSDQAVVMKITFEVDYDYRSHHYTYSQTTLS